MRRLLVLFFLGVLVLGCNQPIDPDPVQVVSAELDIYTVSLYATGTGRVQIDWYLTADSTGAKVWNSQYEHVDGEGNYTVLCQKTDIVEGFLHVVVSDTAGTQLATTNTETLGEFPTQPPRITRLFIDPGTGTAPLDVYFEVTVDPDGTADEIRWDFNNDGEWEFKGVSYTGLEWTYYDPGTFSVKIRAINQWGTFDTTATSVVIVN